MRCYNLSNISLDDAHDLADDMLVRELYKHEVRDNKPLSPRLLEKLGLNMNWIKNIYLPKIKGLPSPTRTFLKHINIIED